MATSMFSNFTSAGRRKKVVTYGKSSRLSTMHSPAPASTQDAPSPERPRKHTGAPQGSLKRPVGSLKADVGMPETRTRSVTPDIFDVPSDEDTFQQSLKPAQRIPTKHKPSEQASIPDGSDQKARLQYQKRDLTGRAVRNTEIKKASGPTATVSIPRPPKQIHGSVEPLRKSTPVLKSVPIAVTKRPSHPSESKPKGNNLKTVATKQPARLSPNLDVFDFPSSDEEAPLRTPKQLPKVLGAGKGKGIAKSNRPRVDTTHTDSVDSEDSSTSKKRKRRMSVSSIATVTILNEHVLDTSQSRRGRKHQRRDQSTSIRNGTQSGETPAPGKQHGEPALSKPQRTRVRTVPVLARPGTMKGHSSPASLISMLPKRQQAQPFLVSEMPEEAAVMEDETMYEVQSPIATPARKPKDSTSGSVTPRQKALFSSLLGDSSSASTPLPKISALQLTDKKPKSLLVALSRSKSDLNYSTQARKTRLIDTIKRVESSSEDESDDSTSEGGDVGKTPSTNRVSKSFDGPSKSISGINNDMDIDVEVTGDSQTSQPAPGRGANSKLTYAKSRSYLQELNPEDALFLSMDIDGHEFDPQKNTTSEDEEEPTSQVQAHHELKRQGQQKSFYLETEMSIDEISVNSNNSLRRTAMIDLCSKMADETFTGQLLDSSLADKFFTKLYSNGEIIFDFACAVSITFILQTKPTYNVLSQISRPGIVANLVELAGNDADVQGIAKERKTNLSKIAQGLVKNVRALIKNAPVWSPAKPVIISPQLVALKALDLLVVGFVQAASSQSLFSQEDISRLVELAKNLSENPASTKEFSDAKMALELIISILEATSSGTRKQYVWPAATLLQLADLLPHFFQSGSTGLSILAVKLCMNITNNKPKACQSFSGHKVVGPLVASIIDNFEKEHTYTGQEQRAEIQESLILSLGCMINLAEFSDQARQQVDDGQQTIEKLVRLFLEGSERAAQADSMEESQSSVAVGYLAVLLGNLCLNSAVRVKVRTQLPGEHLGTLIEKIMQFIRFHEHVDSKSKQFEGEEGQAVWQNYTTRLMLVAKKLEKAEA